MAKFVEENKIEKNSMDILFDKWKKIKMFLSECVINND